MRTRFLWVVIAVLALTLVGQVVVYRRQPAVLAHAVWGFQPKTLAEACDKAEVIARVRVESVVQGPDDVVPAPGEPSGEDRLPTQRVTLRVLKSYKGTVADGQALTLTQTGGTKAIPVSDEEPTLPPRPDTIPSKDAAAAGVPNPERGQGVTAPVRTQDVQFTLEGDPLYKVGEKYVLLLERGQAHPDLFVVISPEGRYRQERTNKMTAMADNDVTQELKGKSLENFDRKLKDKGPTCSQ